MNRLLIATFLLCALFLGAASASAADVYFGEASAGSNNGTDCGNRYAVGSANWTSSQSPGNTLHFCGTITTELTVDASGSAGNLITFKFESGAKFSAATWANNSFIFGSASHRSYIRITGASACGMLSGALGGKTDCDGKIEATDNGSPGDFTNSNDFTGVRFMAGCDHCEFDDFEVSNLYQHTDPDDTTTLDDLGCILNEGSDQTDVRIHHTVTHDCGSVGSTTEGTVDDIEIDHNYNCAANWNYYGGSGAAGVTLVTNWRFHDNYGCDQAKWFVTGGGNHGNCLHFFLEDTGDSKELRAPEIYSNVCEGPISSSMTAYIFIDIQANGTVTDLRFVNNVMVTDEPTNALGNGAVAASRQVDPVFLNNTCWNKQATQTCFRIGMDSSATQATFKNNIGINASAAIEVIDNTKTVVADHNLWYGTTSFDYYGDSGITFAAWKVACSCDDDTQYSVNPNLNGTTYAPPSGSPAVKIGENETGTETLAETDINGAARPSSSAWNVGAVNGSSTAGAFLIWQNQVLKNDCSGSSCTATVDIPQHSVVTIQAVAGDQGGDPFTSVTGNVSITCDNEGSFADRYSGGYYSAHECVIYDSPSGLTSITATPAHNFDAFGTSLHIKWYKVPTDGTVSFDDSVDLSSTTTANPALSDSLTPSGTAGLAIAFKFDNDAQESYAGRGDDVCTAGATYWQTCYSMILDGSAKTVGSVNPSNNNLKLSNTLLELMVSGGGGGGGETHRRRVPIIISN